MKFTERPYALIICALVGLILWYSSGFIDIDKKAWHVFAVFIAVILSFILRPFPMGMMVLIGLIVLVMTKTLSMTEALTGFADSTVWLVIAAFLLAGAMIETGLGKRIALNLVIKLGKTTRGLAYAICGSEFVLATVMPSNTARGGGIHAPIVNSLAHSLDSTKGKNPERAGEFLSLIGAHANLIAAAMFMTGMAANPLISKAAKEIYQIEFGWSTWALGSIVPGLCSLVLLPLILEKLSPPTLKDGRAAQKIAREILNKMGPMSRNEKIMGAVLALLLILWTTKFIHGLGTTVVALIAVATLLLTKAQSWENVIRNEMAWDTLIWLGGLLTMASMLLKYGFIDWFVQNIEQTVTSIPAFWAIVVLGLIYFYSMYGFSMLTAHIASMAAPFLAVCFALGGSPYLAVAIFAYFSCLCGCMTNYSSGPVIIYYGLGYVTAPKWFKIGFLISIFHLTVWLGIGLLWWKILGWW